MLLEITQVQLAQAAGCSAKTIDLFESGKRIPHASTMAKIVQALENRGIVFRNGDAPTVTHDRGKAIVPV